MAQSVANSEFYPPRARGFRFAKSAWYKVRKILQLERLVPPTVPCSRSRFLLWLAVPGAFFLDQQRLLRGVACLTIWLGAIAVYLINLGYPSATLSFLILCSVHALCITAALHVSMADIRRTRGWWGPSVAGFLCAWIGYSAIQLLIMDRLVLAIHVNGEPVLIRPLARSEPVRRGDWVAYDVPFHNALGFEQVLGLPEETVQLYANGFEVDGEFYAVPDTVTLAEGTFTLKEGHYLIWLTRVGVRGHMPPQAVILYQKERATVAREAIRGTVYHQWFHRRQMFPALKRVSNPGAQTGGRL